MAEGGSSLTHLTYLQTGVQDSTQRQIADFNERVQTHFDWLASYSTSSKDTIASLQTPSRAKTTQLPQITPLKGFTYQPSSDRPALALLDTNVVINSQETPRGKRVAKKNAAKQMPTKPPAPSLRNGKAAEQILSSAASPDAEEILQGLDSDVPRRARPKREFKRQGEKSSVHEDAENAPNKHAAVAPLDQPSLADEAPVSVQINNIDVTSSQPTHNQVMELSEANEERHMAPLDINLTEKGDGEVSDIQDTVSSTNLAMEAMSTRRAARVAKKSRAKKATSAVPEAATGTPSSPRHVPILNLAKSSPQGVSTASEKVEEDIDFGALDEAVFEAFSPRSKDAPEQPSRKSARVGNGAKTSAASTTTTQESEMELPKRTRATRANGKATRAARKDEVVEVEAEELDQDLEKNSNKNKKRSREPSAEDSLAMDTQTDKVTTETALEAANHAPSPKRRCTNEDFKSSGELSSSETSATVSTGTPSNTAQTHSPASNSINIDNASQTPAKMEVEEEMEIIAFAIAEADAYEDDLTNTNSEVKIPAEDSKPEPLSTSMTHMDVVVAAPLIASSHSQLEVLLNNTATSAPLSSISWMEEEHKDEEDKTAPAQSSRIPEASVPSMSTTIESVSKTILAPTVSTAFQQKRMSESAHLDSLADTYTSLPMRASTSVVPSQNPLLTKAAFAAQKQAVAARLNERSARIQENRAELEAKRKQELEAKQLKAEQHQQAAKSEKEKNMDRIRERLDKVRRTTETAKTSTAPVVPTSVPSRDTSILAPVVLEKSLANPAPIASITSPLRIAPVENQALDVPTKPTLKKSLPDLEQVASPSPVRTGPPKPQFARAIDSVPWPPLDVPVIRTPPSSPPRRMTTPPTLVETTSAMKLKKATPRRFLAGLIAKEKTPAKSATKSAHAPTPTSAAALSTPHDTSQHTVASSSEKSKTSSSTKKGFWGNFNLFGIFGKKPEGGSVIPGPNGSNQPHSLMSDSPLFVPTAPKNSALLEQSGAIPKPNFDSAISEQEEKLKFKPKPSLSFSPLQKCVSQSTDSDSDSEVVPLPNASSKSDADLTQFKSSQQLLNEYSAGLRNVPLLESSEDIGLSDDEEDLDISFDEPLVVPELDLRSAILDGDEDEDVYDTKEIEQRFQIHSGPSATKPDSSFMSPSKTAVKGNVTPITAEANPGRAQQTTVNRGLVTPEKSASSISHDNPFWRTPELQVTIMTPAKQDSDEEADPRKEAAWTRAQFLAPVLEAQYTIDPEDIFGTDFPATCDLTDIFSEVKVRIMARQRTSSGFWARDKLTADEKKEYKRRMGFTAKTLEKEERR